MVIFLANTQKLHFRLDPATGRLSDEDTRRYLSRVGFALFAMTVAKEIVYFILALTLFRFLPASWLVSPLFLHTLSVVVRYGIAFPIFYMILKPLPAVDPLEGTFSAKSLFGGLCVTFTLMMAGNYVSQLLSMWLSMMMGNLLTNPLAEATVGAPWYVNLIFVGLLAPVVEELVFRRLLCRRLLPLGEGYAIILSAAAFGLCHANFYQLFYAFATGALFALIYVKTGKLRYSIFYHIVINVQGAVLVPWLIEKLRYEELMIVMEEMVASGSTDMSALAPFATPLILMGIYDVLVYALAIVGFVLLVRGRRRIILAEGLLPPPKQGRVANVFLNTGTAAALGVFALMFLLSVLPS